MDARCDLAIIGAGVVGCALAEALSRQPGDQTIWVLEAAEQAGTGISSRNSGVVHAGLYYPPGSRKARMCIEGNAKLWDWVGAHGVGHARTGKLVVACDEDQRAGIEPLLANARASGAELEPIRLARARELEPELPATIRAALWSPRSGIVDAHGLVRSLQHAAERGGVEFAFQASVTALEPCPGGFRLETTRGALVAERVINAAGLGANALAAALGLDQPLYLARGDYFRLRRPRPWRRLIYPIKAPGSPSLGVHLTLELDGRARLGPDLEWIEREDLSPARGERKLERFVAAAARLLGPCRPEDLVYDGCGIRPKLVGPGEALADFEIVVEPAGCWHLLGIESPGLTASLALAEELASEL